MDASAASAYIALLSKVERFSSEVVEANRGSFACRPGCDVCCGRVFTIFAVEAANVRLGFSLLPEDVKERIVARARLASHSGGPCPLLEDGRCTIYAHRPVICRTHGLPLISEHITVEGRKVVTLCDKNFQELDDLSAIPSRFVLDLDRLNATLTAINMLFMKETPGCTEQRVWLHELITRP